ncbi:MAG: FAD-binding protein [Erysipelotrichaceae bacterium]|nr:FAD-binding protein [Erysipelotrichaceae bacterium]
MRKYQAVIIGGGSAGLAAAVTMKQNGIDDILVIEKDREPGGILQQCIHNGFGLQTFKEQLSGPAYAERFIDQAEELGVKILLNTMVTHLSKDRVIEYVNPEEGCVQIQADAVILAVGCYERSRGALAIPGERPAGVFTAGQAQRYLNIEGYLVGKKVFILGSGDIGLIMARRMTLEGAKVYGVAELMPYSNGLPRNIQQCLNDFNIPLYLSHTVTHIYGKDRLERIELSAVDENRKPIPGSEQYFDVDTLLLSVGLIPENHLAEEAGVKLDPRTKGPVVDEDYMTNVEGIFSCGNGLHVHDLVDFVTLQAQRAAAGAVRYLKEGQKTKPSVKAEPGNGIGYVVPAVIHPGEVSGTKEFFFRIKAPVDKAVVKAVCGGRVIRQRNRTKMVPSEMERITLTEKELNELDGDLVIEMEEIL